MQNPRDNNGPRVLGVRKEANVAKVEGAGEDKQGRSNARAAARL